MGVGPFLFFQDFLREMRMAKADMLGMGEEESTFLRFARVSVTMAIRSGCPKILSGKRAGLPHLRIPARTLNSEQSLHLQWRSLCPNAHSS